MAWITGAVAAMAEPPQIEEPTPIKVASLVFKAKKALEEVGYNQGNRNGGEDNRERRLPDCEYLRDIETKTEQNNGILK